MVPLPHLNDQMMMLCFPFSVKKDILVGMRYETVDRYYDGDTDLALPLIEEYTEELSYTDGEIFDVVNGYELGARELGGPCQFLKASISYEVRDSKCEVPKGFICKWTSEEEKAPKLRR